MQKTKIELDSLEQIVCVMNFTSSASCLLSSLFDNHPNVLIFPDNVIQDFEDLWKSGGDPKELLEGKEMIHLSILKFYNERQKIASTINDLLSDLPF